MPRPPRILLPYSVVLLTSRVQQGLPFVCTPLMEKIRWSALALSQSLHPIKIISFVIMENHIHIIALEEDPTNVESFMERFKCESAQSTPPRYGATFSFSGHGGSYQQLSQEQGQKVAPYQWD